MRSPSWPQVALLTLLLLAPVAARAEAETYGSGVDLPEATRIADILADPDAYIGKTVRVDGGVLDVCPKKGCWVEIGEPGESLRIKVEDDVIVFPTDAKGHVASAQGKVEAVEMTRDAYLGWLEHLAEERGEPFDRDAIDVGPGPHRLIRIQGTGARIAQAPGEADAGR